MKAIWEAILEWIRSIVRIGILEFLRKVGWKVALVIIAVFGALLAVLVLLILLLLRVLF